MARAVKDGVKVTQRTAAMMTLAAEELGITVAAMTERACTALLRHEAGQLFEREFAEANRKADQERKPTVQRYDFQADWKPPAWKP